jgi:hypothetical protein
MQLQAMTRCPGDLSWPGMDEPDASEESRLPEVGLEGET